MNVEVLRPKILDNHVVAESGCWEWTRARHTQGYGITWDGIKVRRAHRASFAVFKGEIPDGMLVCHSCDNPCCVNPDHLWLGTPGENSRDKVSKGRGVSLRGSRQNGAKLSSLDVRSIRALLGAGVRASAVALAFGVSGSSVTMIGKRKRWGWLA